MTIHFHLGYKLKTYPYVIEDVLGQGGFGVTYKVRHLQLDQHLVIKIPNTHLQNNPEYSRYIKKFIQEAQTLARLCSEPHPHIVRVNDFFEEENNHCLVMEFVEGETLYKLVYEKGALSEEQVIKYLRPIAEALMMIHEKGIVHRDTNPVNIMIRRSQTPVLIDFGIAKNINPRTSTSLDNSGNKSFAPYEQLLDDGSRETTVDIYSLAASFYYAITGSCPTDSLSRKVTNQPIVAPKAIVSNISDRLNQFILVGMALEPEDRPQSMREWLKLLTVGEGEELKVEVVSEVEEKLTAIEFFNRANDKYKQGDCQGALSDYTQAIKLDSDYTNAYYQRGNAHKKLGKSQKALADYIQVIRLKPDYAKAYYNRGLAYKQQGEKQQARADFRKAADLSKQQGSRKLHQKALNRLQELE